MPTQQSWESRFEKEIGHALKLVDQTQGMNTYETVKAFIKEVEQAAREEERKEIRENVIYQVATSYALREPKWKSGGFPEYLVQYLK